MRQILFGMTLLVSLATKAQSNSAYVTNVVDNRGDMLFTTLYPNPDKETIILLHGGPGFPSDLLEVVDILKDNF